MNVLSTCSRSLVAERRPCAELRKEKDMRVPGKVTPGVIGAAGNAYAVPVNAASRPGQQVIKQASAAALRGWLGATLHVAGSPAVAGRQLAMSCLWLTCMGCWHLAAPSRHGCML